MSELDWYIESAMFYQASLAAKPFGYFLTQYFRASSVSRIQNPNAIGKKKYSTGIPDVLIDRCSPGMYKKMKMTTREKMMAGNSQRFWVILLKAGGCWKMDRRRVLVAKRLNHCLRGIISKC
jgi:hypothetical protein